MKAREQAMKYARDAIIARNRDPLGDIPKIPTCKLCNIR